MRRRRFDAGKAPGPVDLVVHALDGPWSGGVPRGVEEAERWSTAPLSAQ